MKAIIVVHGGAGLIPDARVEHKLRGVKAAARSGARCLLATRNGRQAVCTAVSSMEDDPYFNTGLGSVLNEDGEVEMDAALMDGRDLALGGVGAVGM